MSQETPPGQKRGLKRPIEVVRAELLKDHDTQRIAKAVGMELEAYVELVLQYAQDKDKEPMINVAPEAELRAAGYNPPSNEDVARLLVKVAKGEMGVNEEFEKSEFQAGTAPKGPSLTGGDGGQAPQGNPELMDQVKKGRS